MKYRQSASSWQALTPSTPLGWPSIIPASRWTVPSEAHRCHRPGTSAKFSSRSLDRGADTPTMRNASRFSMRYSISSAPFITNVNRRGGKLFTAAPASRTAEGARPWTD